MTTHRFLHRPHTRTRFALQVSRPALTERAISQRSVVPVVRRLATVARPPSSVLGFQPDPYVDYGRFLTAEGGILIWYKDLDLRLRHTLWRLLAWTVVTALEGWMLIYRSPVRTLWIDVVLLVLAAWLNWRIVAKPVEIYRRVEIRSDCMIIENAEVFWLRFMDGGWPAFTSDAEGNLLLCGTYGTRFVEYLTVRRFDELDRMPEILTIHFEDAMQQLWNAIQG